MERRGDDLACTASAGSSCEGTRDLSLVCAPGFPIADNNPCTVVLNPSGGGGWRLGGNLDTDDGSGSNGLI